MTYNTKEKRLKWMTDYYKRKPEQYEKHKSRMRARVRPYVKFKKDLCERCGSKDQRCVHHIDRNHLNNDPANLITLCISCHVIEVPAKESQTLSHSRSLPQPCFRPT